MADEDQHRDEPEDAEDSSLAEAPAAQKGDGKGKAPEPARPSMAKKRGFFTIYKSGQGYWTRIGTVIGAGVLALMLAYTLYDKIPTFFTDNPTLGRRLGIGVAAAFLVGCGILSFWLMNKPDNVDFLIATDSEMKKVNWTSRKELIGSTKIVVIFMLLIALFLFVVDLVFAELMKLIHVLQFNPFGL